MRQFFSIIISTLNEEKSIGRLLGDLKKQPYNNFEVIIVDGGSTDKTIDIVRKHGRSFGRFTLLNSDKKNISYQRNLGAKTAEGKYLIFLDADVRLMPGYLTEVGKKAAKGHLFITTYVLPDTRGQIDQFFTQIFNLNMEVFSLIGKQLAMGFNFVIEKNLFLKSGGFDESVVFGEDHELSIRIFKKTKVKISIVKKPLLKWSFRRFRKEGRLPLVWKYSLATFYTCMMGKITDKNLIPYQMGGDYFDNMKKMESGSFEKQIEKLKKMLLD